MAEQKSLKEVGRALRAVMFTEENRGLNKSILRQVGAAKILRAIGRTAKTVGYRQNLLDLYHFRMGKVASTYFISLWEALGKREAIVDGDRRFSYAGMRGRVLRLCNALQDLGVRPKDRIACILYNSAEYLESFYAASMIGAPLPAVNWHLSGAEWMEIINLRKPKVLIFHQDFAEEVVRYKKEMPDVEHFIMIGGTPAGDGILSYDQLIEKYPETMPETTFIFAMNPYTGGTTGTPKSSNLYDGLSYLLSDIAEAPRASMAEYIAYMIRQFSYLFYCGGQEICDPVGKNIRTLIPTPMYHAGTAAGFAPCALLGGTAVPMRRFDPENYLQMIEKERINWSFVVPTILQRILGLPDDVKRKYDLSSMHNLLCAAAPCPPEVKEAANELFLRQGAKRPVFHEYYGSSETGIITLLVPEDYMEKPERIHSVGKARCGDLLIYNDVEKRPCDPDENGLVFCRSVGTLSLRYPGSESKLKESQRIIDGQEWYDDGLIGKVDKDGFLYLTSRVKEMIISGGVNIFPFEIERVLFMNPKIDDVAVIRAPHPDLGEIPLACIQLKPGQSATGEELQNYCKEKGLKGFKIPKKLEFYEKLPRHIDGKIIKRDLERKYWENVESRG